MKFLFCALAVFLFAWTGLSAQESKARAVVDAWFNENSRAERYKTLREDILIIFSVAENASVPSDFLLDFLNEAAARGIEPARVVPALRDRLDHLLTLKDLLDTRSDCLGREPPGTAPDGEDDAPLRSLSLIQRRGVAPAVIAAILDAACREHKTFAAALNALKTLANIPSLNELSADRQTALAGAVLASTLTPAGYSALSSFYIKGRLKNIAAGEITDIIIAALRDGKGLIRIEQEMDRRRK
jgi:hypothetical protein